MQGINKSESDLVCMLRTYLGDHLEDNKLIEGYELSDDKLKLALQLALDEFNHTPPFENRTYLTFPSLSVLLKGGAVQSLIMAGIVQSRNYLSFSDGGIQEVISDKAQAYQAWIGTLLQAYKVEAENIKISVNMENGFSVIPSPYAGIYGIDDW